MSGFVNVETAEVYDFWCGAWVLSNVIGRRLSVLRPMAPVYLNVYAVLCAEAGITRKSTAVRGATNLLRTYAERHDPSVSLNTGGLTGEGLEDALAALSNSHGVAHMALSSSELVTLLGKERAVMTLPGKLTDLYDCPHIYDRMTKTGGKVTARNVYLTMLGASTPSWLVRAVNPDVVEGGFTSRCLFIVEDKPKRLVAWPEDDIDDQHNDMLVDRLHKVKIEAAYVSNREGGIRLTRVARDAFSHWYKQRKIVSDPFGASFQAREDHHILRLSALLAASDGSWEVDEHHVQHAIAVIQHVRHGGSMLFGTGLAASRTYALVDRARTMLVRAGKDGISQSGLSTLCRAVGSPTELKNVLTIMHEMGLIQVFRIESTEGGRPVTMYRATRSLAGAKAIDSVVDNLMPTEA